MELALIVCLRLLCPSVRIIAEGRDRAITAVMKCAKNPGFADRFIKRNGVNKLLIAAAIARSPLQETAAQSEVQTSTDTRPHIAVCLSRLIEATKVKGKVDETLLEQCMAQVKYGLHALCSRSRPRGSGLHSSDGVLVTLPGLPAPTSSLTMIVPVYRLGGIGSARIPFPTSRLSTC